MITHLTKIILYFIFFTFATSPITVAIASIYFSKLKNAKSILWVLDLWPDILEELQIIKNKSLYLHYGDVCDPTFCNRIVNDVKPDEIYHLGAQSHVGVSFELPEYTANVDALGTLRVLEAVRYLGLENKTKIYQASTSELYGKVQEVPQNEETPFYPRSPYGVAKLYAYWIVVNYREAFNMFACNGILFNHESPKRGETFVTRKITRGLCNIALGIENCLYIGNLDAKRDWGHAKDYVEMQWLMLQQDKPEDFVIATGNQISVRDFINLSCKELGIQIEFVGKGDSECGIVKDFDKNLSPKLKNGYEIVKVDKKYFRPSEVETLLGDPSKAKEKLGWEPNISVEMLCKEMIEEDYKKAKQNLLLKKHGYEIFNSLEDNG